MKIERTKNATKNITFGIILKLYQIIIPFLMRTTMIYFLGVEYLGLNSLFTSILQVLNLAELGVGSAMIFSMYKPIANDDSTTICALINLYKIYYRIIGLVVLVIGIIICPFVPYLIKSDLPEGMNVYLLYLLNLMTTVFSYWLFAYKNSLLYAHQRNDVISKVTLVVNTIQYIFQLIVIITIRDYYWYIIIGLLAQILTNISIAYFANKMFPNYKAKGRLNKKEIKNINQRVKDLFTAKVGTVIVNSADSIVISAFLGLTVLAIYQNYYYIITAVIGIVNVIFTSCSAGIGNSIVVETKEKNYRDLKKFTFIIIWLSGVCVSEMLCLYQPFMEFWVGKDLLLEFPAVICFCCYYFIYEINSLLNLYKDSSGIWHKDRFRPLVTAVANLLMNLILVNFWGIYGVLLSTVLSTLFVGMPWLIHNLFKEVFGMRSKEYIIKLIKYTICVILIAVLSYIMSNIINGSTILIIVLKGIICFVTSNVLFYLMYRKAEELKETKILINKMMKRKIFSGL